MPPRRAAPTKVWPDSALAQKMRRGAGRTITRPYSLSLNFVSRMGRSIPGASLGRCRTRAREQCLSSASLFFCMFQNGAGLCPLPPDSRTKPEGRPRVVEHSTQCTLGLHLSARVFAGQRKNRAWFWIPASGACLGKMWDVEGGTVSVRGGGLVVRGNGWPRCEAVMSERGGFRVETMLCTMHETVGCHDTCACQAGRQAGRQTSQTAAYREASSCATKTKMAGWMNFAPQSAVPAVWFVADRLGRVLARM